MKTILIIAFLISVSLCHPQKWLCRGVPSPNSSSRFFLRDIATVNDVAQFKNPDTGRTFFWNVCARSENISTVCGDGNAVCVEDTNSNFFPLGKYDNVSVTVLDNDSGVSISFAAGESCSDNGETMTANLVYLCDTNATTPIISVSEETCNVNITIISVEACPVFVDYASPSSGFFYHKKYLLKVALWTFVAFFSTGILCTCCVCIKLRRDRCRRARTCSNRGFQYTELSTQADYSSPIQTQPVISQQPRVPQYFMPVNGVNYPVQMYPSPYLMPQPVQKAPAPATLIDVEDAKANQIEEDEKLARALQAQFNQ